MDGPVHPYAVVIQIYCKNATTKIYQTPMKDRITYNFTNLPVGLASVKPQHRDPPRAWQYGWYVIVPGKSSVIFNIALVYDFSVPGSYSLSAALQPPGLNGIVRTNTITFNVLAK